MVTLGQEATSRAEAYSILVLIGSNAFSLDLTIHLGIHGVSEQQ